MFMRMFSFKETCPYGQVSVHHAVTINKPRIDQRN